MCVDVGRMFAGAVSKLVHTGSGSIEELKCVVLDKVCKSSVHDATSKIEVVSSLLKLSSNSKQLNCLQHVDGRAKFCPGN